MRLHSLWLAVTLFVAPALSLTLNASPTAAQQTPTATVVLRVDGMLTPNCPVLVETAARSVKGVLRAEASLKRRTAAIRYRVDLTSPKVIARTIADRTGFRVSVREP